jgi:hypothetical protein
MILRPWVATSWTPIGNPAAFQCSGNEIAGCPVKLNGSVQHAICEARIPTGERVLGRRHELTEARRRLGDGRRQQKIEAGVPLRDAAVNS